MAARRPKREDDGLAAHLLEVRAHAITLRLIGAKIALACGVARGEGWDKLIAALCEQGTNRLRVRAVKSL